MIEKLTAAYERLLAELAEDLHAACALVELVPESGAAPQVIASYGAPAPVQSPKSKVQSPKSKVQGPADGSEDDLVWVEAPVHESSTESARLRLGFGPDVSPPDRENPKISQAVAEIEVLLGLSGWHQSSLPGLQACRRILAVNEEELQHIILDIHDGPVQKLFAASSQVEVMRSRLPRANEAYPGLAADLARVAALLQASLDEIRNTIGTLRPPEFRRRPLVSVVHGVILQHETLTGMRVKLEVEGELPTVSLPVKIALYRILQEALSNAYRHAKVESLNVRLVGEEGWVRLEVADAGRGFEPPPLVGPTATEREEHIGLRGMRDRAQLVGGDIRLSSRPGRGTRIEVKVPGDV